MTALPDICCVHGTQIRRRPASGGPDLVMLHGIGSDLRSFDRLWACLPDSWGLLAWNAPGYGASEPLDIAAPTAVDYADRLAGLLDDLRAGRVILLGHSLGTLIAADFACRHAGRVRGLALLACAQGYGGAPGRLSARSQARLDDLARLGRQAFAEARAPRLLYQPDAHPDQRAAAIRAMAAIDPAGYAQAVHMLDAGDLDGAAARLRCPSLVAVGAEDIITPPEQSRRVHDTLRAASPQLPHLYAELPGCGHLLHQQDPAEVARRIIALAGAETNQQEGAA